MSPDAPVRLVHVDEATLSRLVDAAMTDADANEVTPPIDSANRWSAARVDWLRSFHRDRRRGLSGPLAEATWAIVEDRQVRGGLRLKRTRDPASLELGLWLTRGARGRGVGTHAVAAALRVAQDFGAKAVVAETTAGNRRALAVLGRLGFELSPPAADGTVGARHEVGAT
jgi:RimJ/RimL family protein N-acetyltransferase